MKKQTLGEYLKALRLGKKEHKKTIESFSEYTKKGKVICPVCGKEYANGIPRYCTECKKRLENK